MKYKKVYREMLKTSWGIEKDDLYDPFFNGVDMLQFAEECCDDLVDNRIQKAEYHLNIHTLVDENEITPFTLKDVKDAIKIAAGALQKEDQ